MQFCKCINLNNIVVLNFDAQFFLLIINSFIWEIAIINFSNFEICKIYFLLIVIVKKLIY